MTAPTREQAIEWARKADPAYDVLGILHTVEDLQSFASVAIANGVQLHPLHEAASAVVKALNDPTLDVPIATAGKIGQQIAALERALAFAAGQSAQSGSGAELVREVEDAAKSGPLPGGSTGDQIICRQVAQSLVHCDWWPRLRAALLAGDAARKDAERLATAHESALRSLQKKAPCFEDTDRLDAIEAQSWCVGKYESNRFYVHLGQINGKQCETTGATLREAIDRARGGK